MSNSILVINSNPLAQINTWLKAGHIVCLYINTRGLFYYQNEIISDTKRNVIHYIDMSNKSSLLLPNDWPWFIENAGFFKLENISSLNLMKFITINFNLF